MVSEGDTYVGIEEARQAVEAAARRVALLHLSYARTLVDELGEERGRRIILAAIREFGAMIGKSTRQEVDAQGYEPIPENFGLARTYTIPRFGMSIRTEAVDVDGERRTRVYGCVLADVWRERGEEELGRLYCYVDPAKYMGYNPLFKQVHTSMVLDGDEYCEMAVRPTSELDRQALSGNVADWTALDR